MKRLKLSSLIDKNTVLLWQIFLESYKDAKRDKEYHSDVLWGFHWLYSLSFALYTTTFAAMALSMQKAIDDITPLVKSCINDLKSKGEL